jgi:alpha-mannosidase
MIGNAHIDAPWLWPLSEADAVAHSTFRSALDRMKEDPQLTMTTSSSQFYVWIEATDPPMLDEIRHQVRAGRWDVVGGWWVEPDVNIPNGESLIRQGLYGQRTLERLFGRQSDVGYNPDSFGHNGNLPQILRLQGMPYYVFMRPSAIEKPEIKQNLFLWQGIDGTKTLTYRVPLFYDDAGDVRKHMLRTIDSLACQPERTDMEFFGVGDHGGGPTKENIHSIRQIQNEPGAPEIFYSTPDWYFAEVSKHLPEDIQVYQGDLQHHSVGTYTAGSERKKLNRVTESALESAEKFSAISTWGFGGSYPKTEFETAWERILLLQFHDSMAGTTLPEYEEDIRNGYGRALDVASSAQMDALQRVAWQIPTGDPDSQYVVVFNPHAWTAKLPVEYDLAWEPNTSTQVEDDEGHAIPFQWTAPNAVVNHRLRLVTVVAVPALGYRQIRISKATAPSPNTMSTVKAHEDQLENEHLRVTFSSVDGISLFDKDAKLEIFDPATSGMRAILFDDHNDTWAHQAHIYDKQIGEFKRAELKVLENGPVRSVVRERLNYDRSTLTLDWILYAGSRKLDVRVALDWHEHLQMLKFSYPVGIASPQATYEIPYGAEARDNKGSEDPGQRWIDVTGQRSGSRYGLTVLNDAKYGYSVHGAEMRVSIARAAVYANHEPRALEPGVDYAWMDQGLQTFQMELLPHSGTWQQAGAPRAAAELVAKVPVVYQGIHPGTRPSSNSFLSIDATDVIVEVVKESEDGEDLIVRSYETDGRTTTATLEMPFAHAHWTGSYGPYEIKTLRIDRRDGHVREVNALER